MNYLQKLTIILFIYLLLASCGQPEASKSFKQLNQLAGKWTSVEGVQFNEHWQIESDTLMTGLGFSISGSDTVFKEIMKIYLAGDSVYFAALTEENEGFVTFSLRESKSGSWRFVNEKHDYPNIVFYEIKDDTLLNAFVANIRGNKKIVFNLKKLKI